MGCDRLSCWTSTSRMISIHAPQWGATKQGGVRDSWDRFQSTHPSGVRRVKPVRSISHTPYFNPRTPVGCDTPNDAAHTVIVQFQSTHLYELAGRHAHPRAHGHRPISIHAPQWGATGNHAIHFRVDGISIHAPQWGATVNSRTGIAPPLFQSTHPSGVRLHHTPGRQIHLPISIHAPQWGATGTPLSRPPPGPYFNPRTPVGCDRAARSIER